MKLVIHVNIEVGYPIASNSVPWMDRKIKIVKDNHWGSNSDMAVEFCFAANKLCVWWNYQI